MKVLYGAAGTIAAFWLLVLGVVIYQQDPPIVLLGGDSVTPAKVRAGELVTVSRSFSITRDQPMIVTRAMISGDCRKACEIVDLPSSNLSLATGDYIKVARDHAIPAAAGPGIWSLQFTVTWRDHVNREHKVYLPALVIEVTG